ncbi:MAG: hypothetical protein WC263_04155 [Candidatus Micrarchaeia archaeon]|jgi:hypothetical protein
MALRFLLIFLLFLLVPAHALFLAGQAEPGGEISILCEGQGSVFLSPPSGELRALPLDSDSQARFFPASGGPHTIQCGNETITIQVPLPSAADSRAYSGGESLFLAAGASIAFIAALLLAAKVFLRPRTAFSKSESNGRVRLCLRAGEDLREIRITDAQGGEGGQPLHLFIPRLPSGAEWKWEYERSPGGPLLAARLAAKCAGGGISLVSGAQDGGAPWQNAKGAEKSEARKLPKAGG